MCEWGRGVLFQWRVVCLKGLRRRRSPSTPKLKGLFSPSLSFLTLVLTHSSISWPIYVTITLFVQFLYVYANKQTYTHSLTHSLSHTQTYTHVHTQVQIRGTLFHSCARGDDVIRRGACSAVEIVEEASLREMRRDEGVA